jgi:PPP family 3-phenylpropionic acid transporter
MIASSQTSLVDFRIWFFLRFTLIGATFPMVGLWVEHQWGDKTKVGLLMGGIGLMQLLSQQMWGYLGDMVFPRRRILLFNMGVAVPLVFLTGFTGSWPVFWAVWIVIAFFMTPVNPMMNAIVMGSVHGQRRYSEIRGWGTIGFVVACLTAGTLSVVFGTPWVTFPIALIGGGVAWLWLWRIHTPHVPPEIRAPFAQVQRFFFSQPHFLWFLIALFINRVAHAPMAYFQAFRAKELAPEGWGDFFGNSLYIVGAVPEIIVLFFGDRLLARFGELRCLMWTTGIAVIRFALVPVVGLPGLIGLQCLHGFTFGLYYIAGVSWMNRHTPDEIKTSAQTIYTMTFFGMAALIGNPVFGKLMDVFGADHQRELFWLGSLVIGLSLMALAGAIRSEPEGPPPRRLPLPGETPYNQ